jgi:membrane-bound serine protease (ClpP class)
MRRGDERRRAAGGRRLRPARLAVAAIVASLGAGGAIAAGAPEAAPAPAAPAGRTIVAPLEGEVDLGVAAFLRRVIRDAGPDDLVILDIDTFGGRIDAAVQVRDALLGATAKTVAFIHPRAISAGALIALATDTIAMAHGGTIGAATPVQLEGGKMQPVEAKVISYFRKEMKATAEAKGRRADLAEAMVDASVEIPGLDGKETTLTLTTTEAIKYGLAAFEADSAGAVAERLHRPPPSVIHAGPSWAERLARFLSDSTISSLLLSLGMLGIMIELWAPGHAVSGAVGVACLLLFAFGHYVVNLAGWETLIIFGAGVALVAIEVVFFPGHGVMVVLGVALALVALTESMVDLKRIPLTVSWSLGWLPQALTRTFGSLLAAGIALLAVARFLPRSRLGRVLILNDAVGAPASATPAALLGRAGVAETALRPTGKALVDGRRVDVVSEGGFIDEGTAVEVVEVAGARVVVRKKPGGPTS